jgi:hypothetical protein
MDFLRRIRRSPWFAVMIAALLTFAAPCAEAQVSSGGGTAASRLRLVADDAQPAATAPAAAPYPLTQPRIGAPGTAPAAGGATGNSAPLPSQRAVDPTVPDAAIRQFIEEPRNEASATAPAFPDIRLRARILTAGRPATALIEIGGAATRAPATLLPETTGVSGQPRQAYRPPAAQPRGVFRTIREGEEFALPVGDVGAPIRVVRISQEEVVIEIVNRKTQLRLD